MAQKGQYHLTRHDKARPSIEILSVIAMVMEERRPYDWVVMYTIRACSMITSVVTKNHVLAVLCITEHRLGDSLRRLRAAGYVAEDRDSGYLAITKDGTKKMLSFQGRRSQIWERLYEYAKEERVKNFTRNKTKPDGQAE